MPFGSRGLRASAWGALFVSGLLGLAGTPCNAEPPVALPVTPVACPPDRIDEQVRIERVVDGDTVHLSDGRKLRFVGIDTPELGRDGGPPEPYALDARDQLELWLAQQKNRLNLRYDAERTDRHQRLLAHAFSVDGVSVNAWLQSQGLGTALLVPPNAWNSDCYATAEAAARNAGIGIWRLPKYAVKPAATLTSADVGFARIRGQVQRIGRSRSALWLNLAPRVALRIEHDDLLYFQGQRPEQWQGHTVQARGWLYHQNGELRMAIRHPAAIEEVTP